MARYPRRLPHLVTRADLVATLAPTYAAARSVDEDEARERLSRALERSDVLEELYVGLAEALQDARGPRTTEDAILDKLSTGVQARRARVKPAAITPAVSAALVRIDVEIGVVPEGMRSTLATDRGRALLGEGLRALGTHLVKQLVRG